MFDLDLKIAALSEITNENELERLAVDNGVAIVVVDDGGRQTFTANDNSICRVLNPDGKLIGQCRDFCGTALEETIAVGGPVTYTCHAGLECAAVPPANEGSSLVTIAGRAFVESGRYRRATMRAVDGDWSQYSPADLFENVLLASSQEEIKETAREAAELVDRRIVSERPRSVEPPQRVESIVERFNREVGLHPDQTPPSAVSAPEERNKPAAQSASGAAEASEWRSFFGSLLKTDYSGGIDAVLGLLARRYGFSSMLWLDNRDGRLETISAYGEMRDRRVRLGIGSDDVRLLAAMNDERPLELGERPKPGGPASRLMNLFPISVGDGILAAAAVLDPITDDSVKKQIVRIFRTLAPHLEILRLRNDVAFSELRSAGERRFSASLRRLDAENVWHELTRSAAEMLGAERASLLIFDPKADGLKLRSIIGAREQPDQGEEAGARVSTVVFSLGEPVVVTDVSRTSLGPIPERGYRTSSFLSYPISVGGRLLGVMNFTDRASGKPFDEESVELFHAIAPQIGVAVDRALLQEMAGEYEQLSVTDPLTDMLNRRYIEERLTEEVKRSNRHGFPMSFMMLDVDDFKGYNDSFGHLAGDDALKLVAQVIRDTVRAADVAARFGGEEFSILLPQTNGDEAAAIAERIRYNVEHTEFPHRRVTLSIGIASCSAELCSSVDLVSAADKALYQAKEAGRNQVKIFRASNGLQNGVREKAHG